MLRPNLLRATGVTAAAALAVAGVVAVAPAAQAAVLPLNCDGTMCTETIFGGTNEFTVPYGVHSLIIAIAGAQGGGPSNGTNTGGFGGTVDGTLAVEPGEKFIAMTGARGESGGGYPNFGGGGASVDPAGRYGPLQSGSGGGGSFMFRENGELVIAAGGGGGGTTNNTGGAGAGAGETGGSGASQRVGVVATGGTQTSPGVRGSNDRGDGGDAGESPAQNSQWGQGGGGYIADDSQSGGGGGGGYYGGGGGGYAESGAGGSGFAAPEVTDVWSYDGSHKGAGVIQLTYRPVAQVSVTVSPANAIPGQTVTLRAEVKGADVKPPTGTVNFTSGGDPVDGCSDVQLSGSVATCDVTAVEGANNVAADYSGDDYLYDPASGSATYTAEYQPMDIRTGALPQLRVGDQYDVALIGAGGDGNYSWSVDAGALPDGLTLSPSGLISGTPTQEGDSSFDVLASDGRGATTTHRYDVHVLPVLREQTVGFVTDAPQDPVVNDTYSPAGSSTSELPVTFAIDPGTDGVGTDRAACTVVDGLVRFVHAGTCVVDAQQGGDDYYSAAPDAVQAMTVGKAPQSVKFLSTPPAHAIVDGSYDVSTTTDPLGVAAHLSVDPATENGACVLDGTTVRFEHQGSCRLNADRAGDADYDAADTQGQAFDVEARPQRVIFTSTAPTHAAVGTAYRATATGGGSGSPVNYSVVNPGTVCTLTGSTVSFVHAGSCALIASQVGAPDWAAAAPATQVIAVTAATTRTTVTVERTAVVAHVTSSAPAGPPTGSVTFTVGGRKVGTAPLVRGVAVLHTVVPAGATRTVAAVFAASTDYAGSSASTSRRDPSITAVVSSAHPKSRFGWYRSPVTVRFRCVLGGSPLITGCPAPVTLTRHAGGQSVTKSITAFDGGADTVVVRGINIDRYSPLLRVTGVRNGATYADRAPKATCVANDWTSGIASCTFVRHARGRVVYYTATATDRAGNVSVVRGHYTVVRRR